MKLFMIIVLAGKIGGNAGPLPYDMEECESRALELRLQCTDKPENPYRCAEIEFKCEWREHRPINDPTAGDRMRSLK